MPQAIVAAAAAIASAFFVTGTAAYAITVTVVTSVIKVAAYAAVAYGLKKAFAPEIPTADRSREVASMGGAQPHQIFYGLVRNAGAVIDEIGFNNSGAAGQKNDRYARAQVIAAHEIDGVVRIFVDGTPVTLQANGSVTSGKYAGKFFAWVHLGGRDQTVQSGWLGAVPSTWWTASRRARGRAWIGWMIHVDPQVFRGGVPNVQVEFRGKKVYDPRLDTTNGGSGAHRADDPATWAYSNNVALCLADFRRSEYGVHGDRVTAYAGRVAPAAWIDWPLVITAANICDESVPTVTGVANEKRYRIAAGFSSTDDPFAMERLMEQTMAGTLTQRGGPARMYAGADRAREITLERGHFAGDVNILHLTDHRQLYTGARGTYISPDHEFRPTNYPPVIDTVAAARGPGEPRVKSLNFPFVPSGYQAQRLAWIDVKRSQLQHTIAAEVDFRGLLVTAGSLVGVNLPENKITDLEFVVERWALSIDPEGPPRIEVDLSQTGAAIWTAETLTALPALPTMTGTDNRTLSPAALSAANLRGVF